MNRDGQPLRPLLEWVLERHPDTPRTRAKQWILAGRVSVAGVILRKPHEPLADPGGMLQLLDRHATALDCGCGWQIHPRVALVFLDGSLAIVNKGPGLISVPAPDSEISALSILADFLCGKLRPPRRNPGSRTLPPLFRKLQPLPVHRLDQYTSGIFCMAMNPAAREDLISQLRAHKIEREYVAFVQGRPPKPRGTWHNWLELSSDGIRQRVVQKPNRGTDQRLVQEAITHFEILTEYPEAGVTKLKISLETGRKHQIRVQAAHAGLPLIGDRTYNPNYCRGAGKGTVIPFERQALHAQRLTLEHPTQPGKLLTWEIGLPKDLRQLEAALQNQSRSIR